MNTFERLTVVPDDPILGLNVAFAEDARETKVNLGVGAYKTSDGEPLVLTAVRKAEGRILEREANKEYLPIDGLPDFCSLTKQLIFGRESELCNSDRAITAQTLGGSGALSIAGQLILLTDRHDLYMSTPTWSNHKPLFEKAGMRTHGYPYYNPETHQIDFDALCRAIPLWPVGAMLLHAGCHNPTGVDPTMEQWKELSRLLKEAKILPVFDMAYQGFSTGLEEDAAPIRLFAEDGHEMIICSSYSKNFGLYGERVGAITIVTNDASQESAIRSQVKRLIRSNYSTPPAHGARIVTTVLKNSGLRSEWKQELGNMRDRINEMRKALVSGLVAKGSEVDFTFMNHQRGMFSFCGLNENQVKHLRDDFAIYMPKSGRINIAGLNPGNLDYVVDSILATLRTRVGS